ncbi:translation initiation factor IF-2-like isoform X4 [Equus quagga]|uniref:translation initiation factor IF-2-like isoform X4 n=1 Tax=Equus quagga TaxID=89248 RepID=UPI001EE2CE74|nr:translation initiation factor IF-2-like isoform X4 [Equus quagga]
MQIAGRTKEGGPGTPGGAGSGGRSLRGGGGGRGGGGREERGRPESPRRRRRRGAPRGSRGPGAATRPGRWTLGNLRSRCYPHASCQLLGGGPHLCLFPLWRRASPLAGL